MLEKVFKLSENKTDAKTEILAGITTFMTMAYILAVNPSILSATGMDSGDVDAIHVDDFDVEVTGSNPGREPEKTYADYRDQGIADEPDGLDVSGIEDVVNGNGNGVSSVSSLYPTVATDVIYFNNVDKAWIYTVDGQLVKYVNNNPESVNVSDLSSAMYVVKMQKGNVVRSQKMFKK